MKPAPRPPSFWQALRDDATFRATVFFVAVVPGLLALATVTWILRAALAGR